MENRLLELPGEIKELELKILEASNKFNQTKVELERLESKLRLSISNKVDEKGKPLYSNAEKRTAALNMLLSENTKYHDIKSSIDSQENEIDIMKIDLKYLYNTQSNIKALYRLAEPI